MPSTLTKTKIKDEVVRARNALWIENVYKEALDLSRFPRVAVVEDNHDGEVMFAVLAFKKVDGNDDFEILFEHENLDECRIYYRKLLTQLQSGPMVH